MCRAGRLEDGSPRALETPKTLAGLDSQQTPADPDPLESGCTCYTCAHYSRAYLHHLFQADEMLGPTLLSLHNVAFYCRLMADIRQAIREKRFAAFHAVSLARWAARL